MQNKNQITIVDLFKFTEGMCSLFINGKELLPCHKLNLLEFDCRLCPLGNVPLFKSMYGEHVNESV